MLYIIMILFKEKQTFCNFKTPIKMNHLDDSVLLTFFPPGQQLFCGPQSEAQSWLGSLPQR